MVSGAAANPCGNKLIQIKNGFEFLWSYIELNGELKELSSFMRMERKNNRPTMKS